MINRKKGIRDYFYVIVFMLMPLVVISSSLFIGKADGEGEEVVEQKGFYLMVEDGLISISANDASLKEILEEIGKRMKIAVVVNIPEEERINVKFHRLSLADSLKKLSSNYGYIMNTEDGEKKFASIFVLAKGKETLSTTFDTKESMSNETVDKVPEQPEAFKFEFDPSEFAGNYE